MEKKSLANEKKVGKLMTDEKSRVIDINNLYPDTKKNIHIADGFQIKHSGGFYLMTVYDGEFVIKNIKYNDEERIILKIDKNGEILGNFFDLYSELKNEIDDRLKKIEKKYITIKHTGNVENTNDRSICVTKEDNGIYKIDYSELNSNSEPIPYIIPIMSNSNIIIPNIKYCDEKKLIIAMKNVEDIYINASFKCILEFL